jgi:single-strand DNA-binding protein
MPTQPDRPHRQFQLINLLARLTADPVLRSTNGGTQVASLRLAVQRPRRNGEEQGVDYVHVVVFGRQAETCAQYLTKGRKVAVNGRLAHSKWTAEDGRDGSRRQKLEVIANTIDFLDRPANADSEPEVVEAAAARPEHNDDHPPSLNA